MPIKSFRGKIADGAQQTIHLHTTDGSRGYRLVKFELMSAQPGVDQNESIVKIYKVEQDSIDGEVDFSDNTLLAAGIWQSGNATGSDTTHVPSVTIFENEIFNQDIYVTHFDADNNNPVNYYIELEMMKLDLNKNTVATLKDIRNETLAL